LQHHPGLRIEEIWDASESAGDVEYRTVDERLGNPGLAYGEDAQSRLPEVAGGHVRQRERPPYLADPRPPVCAMGGDVGGKVSERDDAFVRAGVEERHGFGESVAQAGAVEGCT